MRKVKAEHVKVEHVKTEDVKAEDEGCGMLSDGNEGDDDGDSE